LAFCINSSEHKLLRANPRNRPAEITLPNATLATALTVDLEIGAQQSRGRSGPQPAELWRETSVDVLGDTVVSW
jgi:hypothetical protein